MLEREILSSAADYKDAVEAGGPRFIHGWKRQDDKAVRDESIQFRSNAYRLTSTLNIPFL